MFPAGKAGNVLRGAFGKLLWGSEDFARFFAPKQDSGPSGLADPPRPFVFRAAHLDGCVFEAGAEFYFDAHTFDVRAPLAGALTHACADLPPIGFGTRRGRIEFIRDDAPPVIHDVDLSPEAASEVTVIFRTPTDLKGARSLPSQAEIPFGILFARIRDRIGTLSSLYGGGALNIDYKSMGAGADLIQTVKCEVEYRDVSRRSGRTGDVHSIGGFTGMAQYRGDLTEFMPMSNMTALLFTQSVDLCTRTFIGPGNCNLYHSTAPTVTPSPICPAVPIVP